MLEWREEGIVLAVRRHGEADVILDLLTRGHGRHLGVVRGGGSRRMRPLLQPGAQLDVAWRARLEAHMGSYIVEPVRSRATLLGDRRALAALSAATALLAFCLAERESQPALYDASLALLDRLDEAGWEAGYLRWEVALLECLGFGLSLDACAVTGAHSDLAFVSPRTGRAVSREAGAEWAERLLPLSPLLGGSGAGDPLDAGLRMTGYFLERHVAQTLGSAALPAARRRLVDLLTAPPGA